MGHRIGLRDSSYLHFGGSSEFIQAERLGQLLLGESLFGTHNGSAWWPLLSLGRIEEDELLDLSEFVQQLFDG